MKTLITALLLTASTFSFAENAPIKCFFTEPFVAVILNADRTEMTLASFDDELTKNLVNITFETDETIVATSDKIDLAIFKNIKGNDGMSDTEYDYEGILYGLTGNHKLYGGCNVIK